MIIQIGQIDRSRPWFAAVEARGALPRRHLVLRRDRASIAASFQASFGLGGLSCATVATNDTTFVDVTFNCNGLLATTGSLHVERASATSLEATADLTIGGVAIDASLVVTVPASPTAERTFEGSLSIETPNRTLSAEAEASWLKTGACVTAPGYPGQAAIVEVAPGGAIRLSLAPAGGDAVERLGAAAAIVIDVDRARGDAGAQAIAGGETSGVVRRATAAAAAAAALSQLAPDGSIRRDGGRRRDGRGASGSGSSSVLRSWWLWAAVGGVAAAVGVGIAIDSQRERTIRILPPAP